MKCGKQTGNLNRFQKILQPTYAKCTTLPALASVTEGGFAPDMTRWIQTQAMCRRPRPVFPAAACFGSWLPVFCAATIMFFSAADLSFCPRRSFCFLFPYNAIYLFFKNSDRQRVKQS